MSTSFSSNTAEAVQERHDAKARVSASIACAYGTMVSYIPIIVLTFPMFLKPISTEFGWGRATLSGALLVAGLVGAVFGPIAGRAVDRWGARAVVLPGSILFALAVMCLSLIGQSPLWFYVIFAVIGMLHVAPGQIAYNKVISAWFNKKRGLALGLVIGASMSIGNGASPQIARVLIDRYGWREAYLLLGLIALSCFPVMWALLREPRQPVQNRAAKDVAPSVQRSGMSSGDALKTANFWLIIAIVFCFWLAVNGFRVHIVALFTDRGQSALLAGSVLSVWSVGAFFGHILMGDVLDRVDSPKIVLPFFAFTLLGLLILDHTMVPVAVFVGAALIGLGMGAEVTLAPYLIARFFGLRAAAEIYAYITVCTSVAGAAGPYLMGLSFDAAQSYRLGLDLAAVLLALCLVLAWRLGPYVYAASERR